MKTKLTVKQGALLKNLAKGIEPKDAAIAAGYSDKHPSQSAHNTLKAIERKMPGVMEKLGLTDEALIKKHLLPLLAATETKFFAFRKIVTVKNEIIGAADKQSVEQIIQERNVEALGIRATALDMAFKLKGSYAPKQIDFDPDSGVPVTIIDVSSIPRHG